MAKPPQRFGILEETSMLAKVQPEGSTITFWLPLAELEKQADGSAVRIKQPRIKRPRPTCHVRKVGLVDKQPRREPTFV